MSRDLESAVAPVATAFDAIGVGFYLSGSVISSLFGVARATADIDVVAELRREHVDALVSALERDYYIDRDAALDAIARRSMFNVIHLPTMLKVDIYVAGTAFDRSTLARHRIDALVADRPARSFPVASPEDVVLHKLRWFRDGGEVSDRQWGDIVGVLRMQRDLDLAFMRRWALDLGVGDLLERALADAAETR